MKRLIQIIGTASLLLAAVNFISCKPTVEASTNENNKDNSEETNQPTTETNTSQETDQTDKTEQTDNTDSGSIKIDGSKLTDNAWAFATISLEDFAEKTVTIELSADMKVINSGNEEANLMWQVTAAESSYPIVCSRKWAAGTTDYTHIKGTQSDIKLGTDSKLYISAGGLTVSEFKIYLKNLVIKVYETSDSSNSKNYQTFDSSSAISTSTLNWLSEDVPSIKEIYADQFDSIGLAAEYGNFGIEAATSDKYGEYTANGYWGTPNELYYEEVQKGIAKHANSITLGNELKPQFLLQWWDGKSNNTYIDFTASNGQTIKVPSKLNGEDLIYATLNVCKKIGVQMRGHVLTWHSQTPDGFFAEDYTPVYEDDTKNKITNLVTPEVMTARHEWYIKTVLGCVDDWEKANNYRAIWAWDVVNEAMADDAGITYTGNNQDWLRGSTASTKDISPANGGGSRWYQIYGNEEFIVNAFRFANAYAPSKVKLCYNDYNEYWDDSGHYKTSAIEHIVSCIKNGEAKTIDGKSVAPRFDVIAMQSHVSPTWPGVAAYESALNRFLALADVHVSEIDFSAETQAAGTQAWADYFTMLQKYGKKSSGTHKVTNVTIWGINNENSWINPASEGGKKTYPLLFNLVNNVDENKKNVIYDTGAEVLPQYDVGDSYQPNSAFWAVINAHQN